MKRFIGKFIPAHKMPTDENGFKLCRYCNSTVYPPRRTICSPECQHQLLIRTNNRYLRQQIYIRDKGICNICNLDTKKIASIALSLDPEERKNYLKDLGISLKRKIWKRKFGGGLWDADHIIPVKDGGGCCGLENIRTLCIPCHKKITFSK